MHCLHTANKYMILGGQHFLAAILTMRKRLLTHTREDDLPTPYRYATALVLGVNASWSACRSAAAAHQAQQHNTLETSTADVCNILMELILVKKKRRNSVYLTDEELFGALQSSGMVRGCKTVLEKNAETAITHDEALAEEQKQVHIAFGFCNAFAM